MVVKDRLSEMQSLNDSSNSKQNNTSVDSSEVTIKTPSKKKNVFKRGYKAVTKKGKETEGETVDPFTQLQDMDADISANIDKLDELCAEVKRVQSSYVVSDVNQDQLERLTNDFKANSKDTKSKLAQYDQLLKTVELGDAERRMVSNTYGAAVRRVVQTQQDFNTVTGKFYDQYRAQMKKKLNIAGISEEDADIDGCLDRGEKPQIFTQNMLQKTSEAKLALSQINERYDQLLEVEKSLTELSEMFKDLSMIVNSQGETIDRIEDHIGTAVSAVESGQGQLKSAQSKQSGARRKKIYCSICLAVVIVVVIIIIAVSFA